MALATAFFEKKLRKLGVGEFLLAFEANRKRPKSDASTLTCVRAPRCFFNANFM